MARLGATTVLVPGGNVPASFDKKEIDAAELLTPAVDQRQGLKDKVKLIYMPGWHQPETVLELLVNKDRWNALDRSASRACIETACKAMLHTTLAESPRLEADALAELAKDRRSHRDLAGGRAGALRSPGRRSPRTKAIATTSSRPCSTTSTSSAPKQPARDRHIRAVSAIASSGGSAARPKRRR